MRRRTDLQSVALLADAHRLRSRALEHRKLVLQASASPLLDDATFTHIVKLLMEANELEARARRLAQPAEDMPSPATEPGEDDDGSCAAPVSGSTSAATVAAVLLPGGMMLGAAALAAAPYLGVDPSGSFGLQPARARARATLRRDGHGRFGVALREEDGGVRISSLHASDAAGDERIRLREGDYLYAIDGVRVRSPPSLTASEARHEQAPPTPAAVAMAASGPGDGVRPPVPDGGVSGDGLWDAEAVRAHIRNAPTSVTLEVWREAIRPATERLGEFHSKSVEEVQGLVDASKPHLERAGVLPHLERASTFVKEVQTGMGQRVEQVRQRLGGAGDEEQRAPGRLIDL